MKALQFDFDNLPPLPFAVYLLDQDGKVWPKSIYTVTRKRFDTKTKTIELYILEIDGYIVYDQEKVVSVSEFFVNDGSVLY